MFIILKKMRGDILEHSGHVRASNLKTVDLIF